ncbi:MAG: alpha-mannosidase, partial [Actinobacteria bacterium]|nr:alpha-mannosidase [Actinomycetota bacterium]
MTDLADRRPTDDSARVVHHVDVVAHTHWDREWYSPFPTFRLRLVDLLDELLPRLESDPGFTHFQLDGQMAVVDDYLGLRPGSQDRLRRLASTGRLSMGPWYVLPDEFLVSGETHVRNLQRGLRRAGEFGGAMQVGYLPDMFGHIAQMPQILAQFGFADAVVWRGVPSEVHSPAFRWEAPDGSAVRAEYLPAGYGNGSELPEDPAQVREKVEAFRLLHGDLVGDPILLMAGMDHEVPPAHLSSVIAALDAEEATRDDGDVYELRICSLAEHLASSPRADLPVISGEMRSGHRANVLMGVASNRVDVKQAAARAERILERIAEPLAALWLS